MVKKQILVVPFFRQHKIYTCGPAALQMVCAFFGIRKTRKEFLRLCRPSKEHGTPNKRLVRAARSVGLHVHAHANANLRELRSWISRGIPVIVDWLEPEENEAHFSVVIGFRSSKIVMHDPWHGPRFTVPVATFVRRWHAEVRRWLLVCSPKPLPKNS